MRETLVILVLVGALGALLLPLPPFALDLCLSANLIFALSLFVISLYLNDTLKLSALPTLLLLTTLFRVGMGVAATRSILSSGEAGHAVAAFGSVVMQGSVVVGLVVFMIITLVQFLVIAKGAERVAEVSARFSLDAMPGRQMSIDADVRSGIIDPETARLRRLELQTESRFFGALDGSMKFIKGDAIAGMVIVAVNIIGGLCVGLLEEGLPIGMAFQKYTLLSVGEGLLSQIPALLNALAAGMVVTRVSREGGGSLANEMISQLGQFNKVKVVAGVSAIALSFLPGMPTTILIIGALGLFIFAGIHEARVHKEVKAQSVRFSPSTTPLLQVSIPIKAPIVGFSEYLEGARQEIFEKWGILLSPIQIQFTNEDLITLKFRGVLISKFQTGDGAGNEVKKKILDLIEASPEEYLDDVGLRRIIDFFENHSNDGVRRLIPDEIPFSRITQVCRLLLAEKVPLRNIDLILQAISEHGKRDMSARDLLEYVRLGLKRVLCYKLVNESGELACYSLDPSLDIEFQEVTRGQGFVSPSIIDSIVTELKSRSNIILLTSRKIRLLVSECLRIRGVINPVLAHDELVPEITSEMLGIIPGGYDDAIAA